MTTIDLPDAEATQALGQRIAALLEPGDVVALTGGLGAGKTTLARAILAALGHEGEVPSPSFTIVETYDPPAAPAGGPCRFLSAQRPAEAEEIGLDDYR
jgi:tRNA threonylcarbamoyladenosine biosynthesis protein TsaE